MQGREPENISPEAAAKAETGAGSKTGEETGAGSETGTVSGTSETAAEKNEENSRKKSRDLSETASTFEFTFIFIMCVLFVFTFILRPVRVSGRSMNPTFYDNDKLFITMFEDINDGDVVVANIKNAHLINDVGEIYTGPGLDEEVIKRVIATEGQTIDIDFVNGIVTVDGVVLEEDYIQGSTTLNPDRFDYPLTIPEGYVFLMGDNREHSTDSRSEMMGLVPVESIVGKVRLRFLPFGSIKFYE